MVEKITSQPTSIMQRSIQLGWQWILFLIIYYANNYHTQSLNVHTSMISTWDQQIRPIGWMILPYMSSGLLFGLAFLRSQSRASLQRLSQQTTLATLSAGLIFFFFPLSYGAVDHANFGVWSPWYDVLHTVDNQYNQMPSLHVMYAIILFTAQLPQTTCSKPLPLKLWRPKTWVVTLMLGVWSGLLIVSTLFTQQHHIIDIISALIFSAAIIWLTRRYTFNSIAFFYLANMLACLLLAGIFPSLSVLFVYCSLGCLLLSIAYLSRRPRLLGKAQDGGLKHVRRMVIWPYLIGYHLLWRWKVWRRSAAFISVGVHLYLGRHLSAKERAALPQNTRCLDLGAELAAQPSLWLEYQSLPLLDLAPIDARQMLKICRLLELWQQRYPTEDIYVHCTMGISRSVAAILCYARYQGRDDEELAQRIEAKAWPTHVPEHYLAEPTLLAMQGGRCDG